MAAASASTDRIHGDDITVPVLAKGHCRTGRIWTYVRDDRPFGGADPPAAVFFYSPDRAGIHPERHLAGYSGILQADAYAGFNTVYKSDRPGGTITEAGCWAHARRKLFELADIASKARNQKSTTISSVLRFHGIAHLLATRLQCAWCMFSLHAVSWSSQQPKQSRWFHGGSTPPGRTPSTPPISL
jgi:transposase